MTHRATCRGSREATTGWGWRGSLVALLFFTFGGPVACGHAKAKEDPSPEAPEAPEAAATDTDTVSTRLRTLGQEISLAADRAADRVKPDLERLERKRLEISEKVSREGERVNHRLVKAVDSLEDDLRVLRSRITGPEPRTLPVDDGGEDEAKPSDEAPASAADGDE